MHEGGKLKWFVCKPTKRPIQKVTEAKDEAIVSAHDQQDARSRHTGAGTDATAGSTATPLDMLVTSTLVNTRQKESLVLHSQQQMQKRVQRKRKGRKKWKKKFFETRYVDSSGIFLLPYCLERKKIKLVIRTKRKFLGAQSGVVSEPKLWIDKICNLIKYN